MNRKDWKVWILALVIIIFTFNTAECYSKKLAWDANKETNIAGYKLFIRTEGGSYNWSQPVYQGAATTTTVNNLVENTAYYLCAKAYDTNGLESNPSSEVNIKAVTGFEYWGTYTGDNYSFGEGPQYWNVQPVNPHNTFKFGQTVYFIVKGGEVYADHQWQLAIKKDGAHYTDIISDWVRPDKVNGWDFSVFTPYMPQPDIGSYTIDTLVNFGSGWQLFQSSSFIVDLNVDLINIPYAMQNFGTGHGYFHEDHFGTSSTLSVSPNEGAGGSPCLVSQSSNAGIYYQVQVKRLGWNLANGTNYQGSITLKAERAGRVYLALQRDVSPWDNMGLFIAIDVTTGYKAYNFSFTTNGHPELTPKQVRFAIMRGELTGKLWIDDINIDAVQTQLASLPYAESFDSGEDSGFVLENRQNTAMYSVENEGYTGNALVVENFEAGQEVEVQLKKIGFDFMPGRKYKGSLMIKADRKGKATLAVERADTDKRIGAKKSIKLSPEWKKIKFTMKISGDISPDKVKLTIALGRFIGRMVIDDIIIE